MVWRLDRLGRTLPGLIELLAGLGRMEAGFQSLTETIDTTTAGGRLIFHMMGALAEFERSLIAERTSAGMKAAKRRGRHVGRPRKLSDVQIKHARELLAGGERTRGEVAGLLGASYSTLRRALNRQTETKRLATS